MEQLSPLHISSYSSSQSSSQRTPPKLPPSSPYSNTNQRSSSSRRSSKKVKKEKASPTPVKRESQSNRTSPYETRSKKRMKIEESPSTENNKKNKRERSQSNSSSKSNTDTTVKVKVTVPRRKSKTRKIRSSPQSSDFESEPEDDNGNDNSDYENGEEENETSDNNSVVTIHSDEELIEMERAANISENRNNKNKYSTYPRPLTVFKYDKSHYSLLTDQEFKIVPDYDGDDCEFSIDPPFPEYISFNKSNGEIEGKCPAASDSIVYNITCSNSTNILHFQLSIDVKLVTFHFNEEYKSDSLELSKGGTYVTSLKTNLDECTISHCFVGVEMVRGIYHIVYQSFTPLVVLFGATTYKSNDPCIHDKRNSWTIDIHKNGVILYGKNQCKAPKWKAVKNAVYEMIYNMENKTISIKFPDGNITELFKHVGTPLYPFVGLFYKHSAVKLISVECDS